ncbi:hypothetical protein CCMA1212_005360 [Trichoderma ghanense]|uniref:Uncharacterized protein n=1 Tax=Trichoderma ghanense TaxID=65468 RepID=A0ABY2H353_9HYPO
MRPFYAGGLDDISNFMRTPYGIRIFELPFQTANAGCYTLDSQVETFFTSTRTRGIKASRYTAEFAITPINKTNRTKRKVLLNAKKKAPLENFCSYEESAFAKPLEPHKKPNANDTQLFMRVRKKQAGGGEQTSSSEDGISPTAFANRKKKGRVPLSKDGDHYTN